MTISHEEFATHISISRDASASKKYQTILGVKKGGTRGSKRVVSNKAPKIKKNQAKKYQPRVKKGSTL